MTSLAAWAAVDSRATSSFYLASDSRISFEHGSPPFDSARKLFASSRYPDLFGYCGDVDFAFSILDRVLKLVDGDGLFSKNDAAEERNGKFEALLEESFAGRLTKKDFTVLHASRDGEGMSAFFSLWSLGWSAERGWVREKLPLPTTSAIVLSDGSGGKVVIEHNEKWLHLLPGTSRSVFSAFCDALESHGDLKSGGAPQLVGLYRKGPGLHFGVIYKGKRFLLGAETDNTERCSRFEWRNSFFELCDFQTLERLPAAQRQPRPKGLES